MTKGISINGNRKNKISFFPFKNDTFVIDYKYTVKELIYETGYCMVAVGSEYKLTTGREIISTHRSCKETPVRDILIKKYIDLLRSSSGSWNWDLSLKVLNELKVYNTLKDQTKMVTLVDIMLLMSYKSKEHQFRKMFNCKFNDMYLVFEKYGNDLGYILRKGPSLDMSAQKWLLSELLSAVSSLHSQKLIHRDLRPSNVCVSVEEKILKLKSFGLSCGFSSQVYLNNSVEEKILKLKSFGLSCGFSSQVYLNNIDDEEETDDDDDLTPIYAAPKIILGGANSPMVDVWGVGCIFAEILGGGGSPLFFVPSGTEATQISKIGTIVTTLQTKGSLDKLSPSDPSAIDLLRKMLDLNPDDRISLEDAMQHPYFGSGTEQVCVGSSSSSGVASSSSRVVEVNNHPLSLVEPDAHTLRKLIWTEMETFEMNKKKKTLEMNMKKRNFEMMNNQPDFCDEFDDTSVLEG